MKRVKEYSSLVMRFKDRLTYGPAKLVDDAIIKTPELHFRKDDRSAEEVFKAGGFIGRNKFTGCPVELSKYIQTGTPPVGISGCPNLDASLAWNLDIADPVGRKKPNPPRNMFISLVDTNERILVSVPILVQMNGIGFLTDSGGCRIQIHDDNGKVIGFENKYVPEQELLVIGDIPTDLILTCVDKEDQQRFKDNERVANQMFQFNHELPEQVRAADVRNYTSIMSALLQDNKTDTAVKVAKRIPVERVLAEAKANNFEPKHTDMLLHFMKSVHQVETPQEVLVVSSRLRQ